MCKKAGLLASVLAATTSRGKAGSLIVHDDCRDLLLALHNVPQAYDEGAILAVLQELTPANVRIMWSSKLFEVTPHPLFPHGPSLPFQNPPLPASIP